jgi:hypothetical protein
VRRRRIALGASAGTVVLAGLFVTAVGSGDGADILGDALYGALIYLVLALLAPRRSRRVVAAIALILCAGVEFLQLTGVPRSAAEIFPPASLVLGSGFDQRDLLVYAAAVVITMVIDAGASSRAEQRRRSQR